MDTTITDMPPLAVGCLVALSKVVRAEAAFPHLVAFAIEVTGPPWAWEYGDVPMWDGNQAA